MFHPFGLQKSPLMSRLKTARAASAVLPVPEASAVWCMLDVTLWNGHICAGTGTLLHYAFDLEHTASHSWWFWQSPEVTLLANLEPAVRCVSSRQAGLCEDICKTHTLSTRPLLPSACPSAFLHAQAMSVQDTRGIIKSCQFDLPRMPTSTL